MLPSRTAQPSASATGPAVAPTRPSIAVSTPQRAAPSAVVSVTTTTVTPTSAATASIDSGSTSSGWIVAGVVLVLALAIGIPLVARHRRQQRWQDWQQQAKEAVVAGRSTEHLLPISPNDIDDLGEWEDIGHQVEQVARRLDAVADSAPNAAGNAAAHDVAKALRELSFTLEYGRTVQGGERPMADLVGIEVAVHDRRDDLEVALADLDELSGDPVH